MNKVFDFLDGRSYTLNGVSGTFDHRFDYVRSSGVWCETLVHVGEEHGRVSNVSNGVARVIAADMGYIFGPDDK